MFGWWNELSQSELPFHYTRERLEVTHSSLGLQVREVDSVDFHMFPAGDSTFDGVFDSADIIEVFRNGKFDTDQKAMWHDGDWNGDRYFNSSDLVTAFQAGTYDAGPLQAAPVPEPSALLLVLLGVCGLRRLLP